VKNEGYLVSGDIAGVDAASERPAWRFVVLLCCSLPLLACVRGGGGPSKADDLSSWSLPSQVAGFVRVRLEGGADTGEIHAGYDAFIRCAPASVSVFVYPATELSVITAPGTEDVADRLISELDLNGSKAAIEEAHPTAVLLSEGPAVITQRGQSRAGHVAMINSRRRGLGSASSKCARRFRSSAMGRGSSSIA
jgi:hypothetical protein